MRVLDVHKEEDDQRGLDGRDGEGDYGVEGTEVDESGNRGIGNDAVDVRRLGACRAFRPGGNL